MSCKADVRKAIYDMVVQEATEGRYTFTRLDDNTIQINGKVDNTKTKAQNTKQARAIAYELVNRTSKSFSNQVLGYVEQVTPYDPITVRFRATDAYVNWAYSNLPKEQQTDGTTVEDRTQQERNYINNNTGPNTDSEINFFAPSVNPTVGVFAKYLQFKKTQASNINRRIAEIERQKKASGITTAELTRLKNLERELKLTVNGSFELSIKGIKDEIADLEANGQSKMVEPYAIKDLKRLGELIKSNDLDDLNEAQHIIDFWTGAADFAWRNDDKDYNPFFSKQEIFLEDQNGVLTEHYKIPDTVRDEYKKWAGLAQDQQGTIDNKKAQITVDLVNRDYGVQKTFGKNFTFSDLIYSDKGLKDADWLSMWTMDITQGIASHNGIIPQAMFSYLTNSFEKKLGWAREIEEKIDKLNPKVQKELLDPKFKGKYSLRGLGILGLNGASYNIFKEITKEGNETGGIVQRFVKEFFDEQAKASSAFRADFEAAKLVVDKTTKAKMFNKAFEELKRWRRNNTTIIDVSKIPEIANEAEFAEFNSVGDTAYKQKLLNLLGQKGYDEAVDKQKTLLRKYQSEKQSMLDTALYFEGKANYADLSQSAKDDLQFWENNHSPIRGNEDYNSPTGVFVGTRKVNNFMDFNHFVPRKYKPTIAINSSTNQYEFTDTTTETGHYDKNFATIEGNPILSDFYDVIKEVTEVIRENIPLELQQKIAANTLPGLMKTSAEIIADKNTGILNALSLSFKHMWERLRVSFGVHKQSELSYANPLDPVTGKPNYKVNDGFLQGNAKAVSDRMAIEKIKFLQAFNANKLNGKVAKIKRFTTIKLSSLNEGSARLLAEYAHIDISEQELRNGNLSKIQAVTGDNIEIGRYIRDYSIHSIVQSQSFDLGKLAKYFSNMTMTYAARQEALPILEIMKKHYETIKKPHTNNIGNQIKNVPTDTHMQIGFRTGAIRQMDDWFERVALDNYGPKHDNAAKKLSDDGLIGKNIYTKEERKRLNEINDLLADPNISQEEADKLRDIKDSLGKVRTATAAIGNLLSWIRTLRLGYNLSSATTNFMEGVTSNLIIGASNQYFNADELFYGYGVIKHSFLKNITFGKVETIAAGKNRSLMDKFNVIMDSKNELQKSSVKTTSSRLSWAGPHELNQRVEFINQSPLMIAMLRSSKIKGLDGSESTIWDAYDKHGHLKPNFKTPHNIENWEELSGSEYLAFKQKLNKIIVLAHGNYDELRGMMAKSNSAGKAFMMFKTWLPNAIYQRFAVEQDDIQAGVQGYKGKYFSYTPTTAAIHVGVVGTAVFGPFGILAGAAVGGIMGVFKMGVQTDVGVARQTIEATKTLFKKMLGTPVNLVAGKKVIGVGTDSFDKWVGRGEFTQMDANNLKSNMADLSMQLAFLALILITKSLFWDDDDKKDDPERMVHNILVNKLMQLSSQAAMYINPIDKNNVITSTLNNIAVFKYLDDTGKFMAAVAKWANGESDVIPTGTNAGESRIGNAATKLVLPGIFKDIFGDKAYMVGFQDQADKVFTESPFHKYYRSDLVKDKHQNTADRSARKSELEKEYKLADFDGDTIEEQEKAKKSYINKQLNEELPTPTKLKKLGLTRKEFKEQQ